MQQRTNTVTVGRSVATGFSRWSFRCLRAHLLLSPSDLKSGIFARAALLAISIDTPSVANIRSPLPILILRRMTSSRCRAVLVHRSFLFCFIVVCYQRFVVKTKNPASFSVSRVQENSNSTILLPAHLRSIPIAQEFLPFIAMG